MFENDSKRLEWHTPTRNESRPISWYAATLLPRICCEFFRRGSLDKTVLRSVTVQRSSILEWHTLTRNESRPISWYAATFLPRICCEFFRRGSLDKTVLRSVTVQRSSILNWRMHCQTICVLHNCCFAYILERIWCLSYLCPVLCIISSFV